MMISRATSRLAMAAIGAAVVLSAAVPASASLAKTTTTTTTAPAASNSSKGTNPKAPLCKLEKAESVRESKSEAKLEKALSSANWSTARKDLLAAFKQDAGIEKQAIAMLSSAPKKVKAAAALSVKFAASEQKIIAKSKTEAAYQTALQKAESSTTLQAAESTLVAYLSSLCGSPPTTT